jgi:GT2 family glycosyltransferase
MKTPLVSIVVICWNNKRYLADCLASVLSQTYPDIEVVLTDNASSDGSAEYVRQNFPSIKVIQNERNLGFAEGNNVAMKQAKGKYVVTLNPDTKVDERWIEELVKVAENDKRIGSCASKVLFLNNPKRIDSVGELILRTGDAMGKGFYSIDSGQYDEQEEIFGVTAGAGFYRKRMLNEIGLFDKDLFTWYEDVDLMWRIRLTGWKCIYVPSAIVYHHHSGTVDDLNPMKIYHLHRNKLYVIFKNYSLRLLKMYSKIIAKSEFLFFTQCIREKNKAGVKGQISAILNLPKILIKRLKAPKKQISFRECIEWIEKSEKHFIESKGPEGVNEYFEDLKRANESPQK